MRITWRKLGLEECEGLTVQECVREHVMAKLRSALDIAMVMERDDRGRFTGQYPYFVWEGSYVRLDRETGKRAGLALAVILSTCWLICRR